MEKVIEKLNSIHYEIIHAFISEDIEIVEKMLKEVEKKVSDKKNKFSCFTGTKKKESLKKELEFKKDFLEEFENSNKLVKRMTNDDFFNAIDEIINSDEFNLKRYLIMYEVYTYPFYLKTKYDLRDKDKMMSDLMMYIKLDKEYYTFMKKSLSRITNRLDKIYVSSLINGKSNFELKVNAPYVYNLFNRMSDEELQNGTIQNILLKNEYTFILDSEKKEFKDLDIDSLKIYCNLFLLIHDYMSKYLPIDNNKIKTKFVASFFKYKNQYEEALYQNEEKDVNIKEKIKVLNRITTKMNLSY